MSLWLNGIGVSRGIVATSNVAVPVRWCPHTVSPEPLHGAGFGFSPAYVVKPAPVAVVSRASADHSRIELFGSAVRHCRACFTISLGCAWAAYMLVPVASIRRS